MFTDGKKFGSGRDAEAVSPYLERRLRSLEEAREALAARRAAYERATQSSRAMAEETRRHMNPARPRIVWNRDWDGGARRDQSQTDNRSSGEETDCGQEV